MANLAKHIPVASGSIKAWASVNQATAAYLESYNFASITDNGTGNQTYLIANDMASSNYAVNVTGKDSLNAEQFHTETSHAVGSFNVIVFDAAGTAFDDTRMSMEVVGDLS